MCGFPCSGKTKRANELKTYLETSRGKSVHLSSDESLNFERNTAYASKRDLSNVFPFSGKLIKWVSVKTLIYYCAAMQIEAIAPRFVKVHVFIV